MPTDDRPVAGDPAGPTHVLLGLPGCSGIPCSCPATGNHDFEGCDECFCGLNADCGACECHE